MTAIMAALVVLPLAAQWPAIEKLTSTPSTASRTKAFNARR